MNRFKTKTVVITGAGSGFGRGLALDFARLGWKVAASDIDMTRAEETVRLVNNAGGQGLAIKCDVTNHQDVQNMSVTVLKVWGGVDIIINNAGVPVVGIMEEVSLEDWRFEIDIMLMSVIYGCRAFIPVMKKQGRGHIVNVASSAGIVSLPEMGPYNITKAGVISLSETLRSELKKHNIGVTVVCPTFFKTNLLDHIHVSNEHQMKMAQAFFNKFASGTVESISKSTMKAIRANRLYVLPQANSKLLWMIKRIMPQTFNSINAYVEANGLLDKMLGISK